jgi:hypothetical protein
MPPTNNLTLPKMAKHLQISLVPAFTFSSSLYKNGVPFFTYPFQKTADLLKVPSSTFFCYAERLQVLLVQQSDHLLYIPEHLFLPFPKGFLP